MLRKQGKKYIEGFTSLYTMEEDRPIYIVMAWARETST